MNSQDPPKWAVRFFRWICSQSNLEGLEGDLYELFERRAMEHGHRFARLKYLLDMLTLMRGSIIKLNFKNSKSNKMEMLRNYVKIGLRSALRRKSFALINLFGLTLGISAVLFISIYLWDEINYDTYQSNVANKYRVYDRIQRESGDASLVSLVPPPMAEALQTNFSQIKKAGRLFFDYGGTVFRVGDRNFSETNGYYAELDALDILDVEFIAGSKEPMKETQCFVLSESLFKKFFNDSPFDNQTVQLGTASFPIAGIYRDFPKRSHIRPDYLASFEPLVSQTPEERMNSWLWHQFTTYVEFQDGVDVEAFEEGILEFVKKESAKDLAAYGMSFTTHFQPMSEIHLHSIGFEQDTFERNNYQNVISLGITACIILLIACLNFVNLTSAQALQRAKEVGIRKFVGAGRGQVFMQHCVESLMYLLAAGTLSIAILVVLLPTFNQFAEKQFELSTLLTVGNGAGFVGMLAFVGLMAGAYPASVLTRVKTIDIVRGSKIQRVSIGSRSAVVDLRQVLVAVQYILSVGLIIISAVVYEQFQYMRGADLGFNKENLIVIQTNSAMRRDLEGTRKAFSEFSNVSDITFSYSVPGGIVAGDGVTVPRMGDKDQSANVFVTDYDFLEALQLELLAGRDFNQEFSTDHSQAFILNEEAVRSFGFHSPEQSIGEVIQWQHWSYSDSIKKGKVIGVVKNFNVKSMHKEVSPTVIHLFDAFMPNMIVRIGNGDLGKTIDFLEDKYKEYAPQRPFEFSFLDQTFDDFYRKEQKMAQLFGLFTGLTIFTALIGLLGLVNFNISHRAKELSIRKVLGAGDLSIYALLIKGYIILVGVSLMVSAPVAYLIASDWLQDFAYRITLEVWIFAKVFFVVLLLTILLVSWRAFIGLRANLVDKLQSE